MVRNHINQPDAHKKGPNGICWLILILFATLDLKNMNKIPETEDNRMNKGRACQPIQAPNAPINFTSPQPTPVRPFSLLNATATVAVTAPPVITPNKLSKN